MENKISRIDEHTWIIDEGMVRFFLLEGSDKALLIDCGMGTTNAKDIAESLTDKPVELILTHADRDHIASVNQFSTFYMSGSEASNFYNTADRDGNFIAVSDMYTLELGGRDVLIIALPGHTPGSIAILDQNTKNVFTGDPIQDGNIFMFGVQRELHAYIHSLVRFKKLSDAGWFTNIYPSHGSYPLKTDILDTLYDDALNILLGNIIPEETDMHGNKVLLYKGKAAGFLCGKNYCK